MSVWEVVIKSQLGKLEMDRNPYGATEFMF
jgi:hypothetical protein